MAGLVSKYYLRLGHLEALVVWIQIAVLVVSFGNHGLITGAISLG